MGLGLALVAAAGLSLAGACTGSGGTNGPPTSKVSTDPPARAEPSIRLYLLSNVAGALEPCGCSKDQLGGADRFAALIQQGKASGGNSLILGAGPLFFQEPAVTGDGAQQARWKADSLAQAFARLGVLAWAPGTNDFGAGTDTFKTLKESSKIEFLAANVKAPGGLLGSSKIVDIGGVSVGIVGVAEPKGNGLEVGPALDALKKEVAELRTKGARVVIALAAIQRGDALRLVDDLPDLDVLVVGKPSEKGDGNDQPKPPAMIGQTVVVETSNHLQTVAMLDLFVREPQGSKGRVKLSDGGAIAKGDQILALGRQIRDLETRINGWESDKNVKKADLEARRSDLSRLRSEKADLENRVEKTPEGSYFTYALVEVRDKLGQDPAVQGDILAYYKRVNENNKVAFKDRVPAAPAEGQASYIGLEQCSSCHAEERAVWDKTDHAKAYRSVEQKFVEFNLDCVGCHVTGYDRPGGSTVTHVSELKNVQCETCHGPGSLHAKDPTKKGLVNVKPDPKSCVSECHHSPHVENFDAESKTKLILGPGHGL